MPRKYSDWIKIRDNYYKATRIQFPYPTKRSIVYDWASTNQFWEDRRQNAMHQLDISQKLFNENSKKLAELGERVRAQGIAERAKERTFLAHALPDMDFSMIDDLQLIERLNEVIKGEMQYKYALDRIKAAMANSDKTGNKNLAPSASSLFTSYLGTEISKVFQNFISQDKISQPFSAWTIYFQDHLNEAIDAAFRAMTEEIGTKGREVNEMYGDAEQWREIGEAYRTIVGFNTQFQQMIRNKIDFNKIAHMFENAVNQKIYRSARRGSKKPGFRTFVDNALHLRARAGQIGGSVGEYVNDLVEKIAPKRISISDKGSTVLQSEMTVADRISVYTFDADINIPAQEIADEINESLMGSNGLKESTRRLDDFYERNLKNLKGLFVEYSSDKMYKLDSDFSGFHNGGQQPLSHLPNYIDAAGIDTKVGLDFVYTAYNTLPTAIYANQREEVKEQITNILTAAAAKLLFNDWSTVGVENTGAQVLHVMNLDGVLVPVSYVLINLGQAMINASADMRQFFSVSVSLPQTVVYQPGDWKSFGTGDENIKEGIYKKWDEQFKTAERESYFSTKFLMNFKQLMKQLI